MDDTDSPIDRRDDKREPWTKPRIVNTTSGRDMESGILNGPEILISLS